ncbi:CG11504 [Drosophila busckii]|uniref:CG11504 n=1 Tax=Drosophila busckii TaxID=30019 RepID=A0A0M4EU40_DROBS|nr:uncharacterized protein LOC108604609 [Drosophila busckii]ALC46530.1 CG11504 [Drosophila busckii]
MEWTREKTLLLISEYRQRRGLWDMTCDEYRKKDVKQRLLNEVSEVLGGNIPIPELEKKFHTLRTQYHREISRMKRKEPYNSKWFGFKNLVFLSSPYACRSTKGRLKTEIQSPENADVQKYVLGEITGGATAKVSDNMNEDYISNARKTHASSRAHELKKLIEETTKDVDEIDEDDDEEDRDIDDVAETKPKISKVVCEDFVDINDEEPEPLELQQQPEHTQSIMELHPRCTSEVETVSFQANESGELHYQSSTSSANSSSMHVGPARILKIQRRDTTNPEEVYFNDHHTPQQVHPPAHKRLFYDPNSTHSTTILTTSSLAAPATVAHNGNASITTAGSSSSALRLPRLNPIVNHASLPNPASNSLPLSQPAQRDEFSTYGEYVANEMRAIENREVLTALKHKINTAIYEANMSELHK